MNNRWANDPVRWVFLVGLILFVVAGVFHYSGLSEDVFWNLTGLAFVADFLGAAGLMIRIWRNSRR